MNVTMKEKTHLEHANQTKAAIKPALFQMKHYPTHGVMEDLSYMLIRPPRFIYNPDILKPPRKLAQKFTVETYHIPFELTFYRQENIRYVILYLHGNGSSRFQGTLFLSSLPAGVGLACFDFCGCGNRAEGEFITLGQQESKDVDVAAKFLKNKGYKVVGWGRSMGAVSLLMSNECNLMIADSAYSNLAMLCKESSSQFLPRACCCIFHIFFPCVFACIQCKVHSLAGLNIDSMDVMSRLKTIEQGRQICFIHGQEDTLVPYHHAQKLYQSFGGIKMLIMFEGTHNSSRPEEVLVKCFEFIEEGLKERKSQLRSNTKILEMVELQKAAHAQNSNINRISAAKIKTSNIGSLAPTFDSSEVNAPRKDTSEYGTLQSEPSNIRKTGEMPLVKEQYCEIGDKESLPANFRDVIDSEDFEKMAQRSQTKEQMARKSKMAQLIFSKKRQ